MFDDVTADEGFYAGRRLACDGDMIERLMGARDPLFGHVFVMQDFPGGRHQQGGHQHRADKGQPYLALESVLFVHIVHIVHVSTAHRAALRDTFASNNNRTTG